MWGSCEKKAKKVNVSNLIPESANGTLTMDSLKHYISSIEGVGGIRPQVTFDAMCKSPYVL